MTNLKKNDLVRITLEDGKHWISVVAMALPDDFAYVLVRGVAGAIALEEVEKVNCKGMRFLYTLNGPFVEEDFDGGLQP